MSQPVKQFAVATVFALAGAFAWAQGEPAVPAPAILPLATEAAPTLSAYPPVPEALARGVVILQVRVEHARILPLFGPQAAAVSPRVGHLHVSVDGQKMRWAHTSADPVIIVGLEPGQHSVLLELADPTHKIVAQERVAVTVPGQAQAGTAHHGH